MRKTFTFLIIFILTCMIAGCSKPMGTEDRPENKFYLPSEGEYDSETSYHAIALESEADALSKGKTVIYIAASTGDIEELNYIINSFNKSNTKYHVESVLFDQNNLFQDQERLKIEIASGKGPDILTGFAVPDAANMMDSGCFLELSSLMSETGITDELFFPSVKSLALNGRVYGVSINTSCTGFAVKDSVLPDNHERDYEAFIDKLLNYPDAVMILNKNQNGAAILRYLLRASDSMRGTINWDEASCQFDTQLFSSILDVCKRYGDVAEKGYETIMKPVYLISGIYTGEESLNKGGWVLINDWFDEGNYPFCSSSFSLMINSSTENVDGAWAFISYALSGYGQTYCSNPTNRRIFAEMMQNNYKLINEGGLQLYDVNESGAQVERKDNAYAEKVIEELTGYYETAKYFPARTNQILDIICEEATPFFEGKKDKKDVIDVIQNRVQLYLNEYF